MRKERKEWSFLLQSHLFHEKPKKKTISWKMYTFAGKKIRKRVVESRSHSTNKFDFHEVCFFFAHSNLCAWNQFTILNEIQWSTRTVSTTTFWFKRYAAYNVLDNEKWMHAQREKYHTNTCCVREIRLFCNSKSKNYGCTEKINIAIGAKKKERNNNIKHSIVLLIFHV